MGSIGVNNAVNHDWEDIAVGMCPKPIEGTCIYVGDIGSDKGHPPANNIYVIREPDTINGHQDVDYVRKGSIR